MLLQLLKRKLKLKGEELDRAVKEELSNANTVKTRMIKLDWQEELALSNLDALKEDEMNNYVFHKKDKDDYFFHRFQRAYYLYLFDIKFICSLFPK